MEFVLLSICIGFILTIVEKFAKKKDGESEYGKFSPRIRLILSVFQFVFFILSVVFLFSSENEKKKENLILRHKVDSLQAKISNIYDYETGKGSFAYVVVYGRYHLKPGFDGTDMVLWTSGINPIKNCNITIADLNNFSKPGYPGDIPIQLGNVMPKPKHPLMLGRYTLQDTVKNLRLFITINSDGVDITEHLRFLSANNTIYTAYKVDSWNGNKTLKIYIDKGWPYNITGQDIWK